MSSAPAAPASPPRGRVRHRVRHQAREAVAVMAFSAGTSLVITAALVLITRIGA